MSERSNAHDLSSSVKLTPIILVITEKPSVSKAICRTLIKDGDDPRQHCCTDVFRKGGQIAKPERSRMYFEHDFSTFASRLPHSIQSKQGFKKRAGDRSRESRRDEIPSAARSRDERVTFYIIERPAALVFIVDTGGNPLQLQYDGDPNIDLLARIDTRKMLEKFRYALEPDGRDPDRLPALMRMELFVTILARECMPCDFQQIQSGTPIAVQRVVSATDDDVAGHAIFTSVLEYVNLTRRQGRKEPLTRSTLARLRATDLTREAVDLALYGASDYPIGIALAGKARSVFDRVYGSVLRDLRFGSNRDSLITLGRVVWLSLGALIREEESIGKNQRAGHLYMILKGIPRGRELARLISDGNYSLVHCTSRREWVSTGRFLEVCRLRNAGTAATRYRLAVRLAEKRLVTLQGPYVRTTTLGREAFRTLDALINPPART